MKKYKKWIAMGVIGFLIFLGFFTGYIPVSYTHLDVYKRQGLYHLDGRREEK